MNKWFLHHIITLAILLCASNITLGQSDTLGFWESSPVFNKNRLNKALIFSTVAYTSFSTGLYITWYKQYPTEGFHTFNDMAEWKQVDK